MLRGTFPLGLPECIRQTAFPCVRGADRPSRVPPRELLANNINSFATAPIKGFPPSPRLRRTREKGDGGPPPHKAMAGQVGEAGKNLSSKSA